MKGSESMAVKKLKNSSRIGLAIILVAVMLICGFVFWKTEQLNKELDEKEYELQQIQEETSDAERENQAMLDEAKYKQTDDYVEDRARDIFGLRDEDDVIFKPGKTED